MEARLGQSPNDWIGADLILHRTTTIFEKKVVPAFRIIECHKGPAPQREPGADNF